MKLFLVDYMDDCESYSYLTIGNSEEEVREREFKKLAVELSCLMYCFVSEVNEIDGHKIIVE